MTPPLAYSMKLALDKEAAVALLFPVPLCAVYGNTFLLSLRLDELFV